jgi:apolipoprotein N-acyltransferase
MKAIKHINTFAIGLPFLILITYPIAKEAAFIFALLSTMATGFIQVVVAMKLLFEEPNNKNLQIYFAGVFLFFGLWIINSQLSYNANFEYLIFSLPALLALYLSILIYKKS